ncbi:hypothetical protein BH11ACT8_BH11ACT8_09460 [soil metagenome]
MTCAAPRRRPSGGRSRALAGALVGAVLLAGCAANADQKTPDEQVADVVDTFAADNTGSYSVRVDLGDDQSLADQGFYRVAPDAEATLRQGDATSGRTTVRFLRLNADLWLEAPGPRGGRSGCWMHAEPSSAPALSDFSGADVGFSTAAVEVVLGLRNGRTDDEGDLVADANVKAVAMALGGSVLRALGLRAGRIDVPVTLTVEGARLTRWAVSVTDLLEAAGIDPDAAPAPLTSTSGDIVATFADPGTAVDLEPPGAYDTYEAGDPVSMTTIPDSCS